MVRSLHVPLHSRLRLSTRLCHAAFVAPVLLPAMAFAAPEGGSVAYGAAAITQSGAATTITQSTQRTVLDWQHFDLAPQESVHFIQPGASSVAVNRIHDDHASLLQGQLNANGQVVLINPNGVIFGPTSRVDVQSLVVSTASPTEAALSDWTMHRTDDLPLSIAGSGQGMVLNAGAITAGEAGLVGFVAPNVINSGVILAKLGKVHLASGDTATLDLAGDGLINVAVSDMTAQRLAANHGLIQADGGTVLLTAAAGAHVANTVVNMDGVIQARSLQTKNGRIFLSAEGSNETDQSSDSTVRVSGTLDASGKAAGQTGGDIIVTGDHAALTSTARADASGSIGGGTIRIGGDQQGKGALSHAKTTNIQQGAILAADALDSGNGGRVILWSDDATDFAGSITARGGAKGGAGGFVETSSHDRLRTTGMVDLTDASGGAGTWLLDPTDITIYNRTGSGDGTNTFTAAQIEAMSVGANVSLNASNNITLDLGGDTATLASGRSFTLTAGHDITAASSGALTLSGAGAILFTAGNNIYFDYGQAINLTTASGEIRFNSGNRIYNSGAGTLSTQGANITMNSDRDSSGGGGIVLNQATILNSHGGSIILGGGSDPTTGYATGNSDNSHGVEFTDGVQLNAGGGNIIVHGQGYGDGSCFNDCFGVLNRNAILSTTGSGSISEYGIGGGSASNSGSYYNKAIEMNSSGSITAQNGTITLSGLQLDNGPETVGIANQAISTTGTGNVVLQIMTPGNKGYAYMQSGTTISAGGNLTYIGDRFISNSGGFNFSAGGDIILRPYTAGTTIGVGSGSGDLSLADAYLARMTAANTLWIGGYGATTSSPGYISNAGAMNINTTFAPTRNVSFLSGGNINLNSSLSKSSGSTSLVELRAGGAVTFGSGGGISASGAGNALNVNVVGNEDASGTEGVDTSAGSIASNGGNVSVSSNFGLVTTGAISTGAGNLTLTAADVAINSNLSGTGILAIRPDVSGRTIRINFYSGDLNIDATELGRLGTGWSLIDFGRMDTMNGLSLGDASWSTPVNFRSYGAGVYGNQAGTGSASYHFFGGANYYNNATMTTAGGAITFDNTLTFSGSGGTINSAGGALTLTGAVTHTSTTGDTVALNAGTGTVTTGSSIDVGTGNNLVITANDVALGGTVGGTGTLTIQPYSTNRIICVNYASGSCSGANLNLNTTEINQLVDGWSQINIGRADIAASAYIGASTWKDPVTFLGNGYERHFSGAIVGTGNASITSGAPGQVSEVYMADGSSITTAGQYVDLFANLHTEGTVGISTSNGYFRVQNQTYLSNSGAGYNVNTGSGSIRFGDALSGGAAGQNVSLTTTGDTSFGWTVNGPYNLTINTGTLSPNTSGAWGGSTPLGSLSVTTANNSFTMPALTSTGNVVLNAGTGTITTNAITTGAGNLTLTADEVVIGGNLSGTGILTLQPSTLSRAVQVNHGTSDFNLTSSELAYLVDGWSHINVGNSASTGTTYVGASTWKDPTSFFGSLVSIEGALTGTGDASFTRAGGFANLYSNITTSGGVIDFGNTYLSLYADGLTLQSAGGDISANIRYGANHPITLNAGSGAVNFTGGPLSTITSVTANAGHFTFASDWGNTGYLGAVTLTSPNSFTLPSLTATGNVALNAGTGTITTATIATGAGNLTMIADDLVIGGNLSGTGILTLQPYSASRLVNINSGTADGTNFSISTAETARFVDGWSQINIGRVDNAADMHIGAVTFSDPIAFRDSGNTYVDGTVTGTDNASIAIASQFGSNIAHLAGSLVTAGGEITTNQIRAKGGNITTNGGNATFGLLVDDSIAVSTSGGNISNYAMYEWSPNSGVGKTVTFNSGSGATNFSYVDGKQTLVANAGNFTFASPWGALVPLGGVSLTSANTSFTLPNLTATGNVALNAGTGTITTGTIATGAGNLTLTADDLNFAGNISGTGNLTMKPYSGVYVLINNGSGGFNLSSSDVDALQDGWNQIEIGRSGAQGLVIGTTTWKDPVRFVGNNGWSTDLRGTLTGTGNASFTFTGGAGTLFDLKSTAIITAGGLVDASTLESFQSNAYGSADSITTNGGSISLPKGNLYANLTMDAGAGTISFGGTLNQAGNLIANAGAFTFNGVWGGGTALGNVSLTSANTSFTLPNLTATGNVVLNAGTGTITTGSIATGTGNLSIQSDDVALNGDLTGTGNLLLRPSSNNINLRVNWYSGDYNLDSTELAHIKDGWNGITLGYANAGTITVGDATWTDNVAFLRKTGDFGNIYINGVQTLNGGASLTATSSYTDIQANITTNGGGVTVNGITTPYNNSVISTSGGAVALNGDVRINAIGSGLTVNSGGGNIGLAGPIYEINGSATGKTLTLNADAGNVAFGNTVNGAFNVSAIGAGLGFNGAWGGSTALGTVSLSSPNGFAIPAIAATNLYLNDTGTVTQTGAITATNLLLTGAGGVYNLTDTGNAITTLAGNTGTVNFLENSGFDIGTVYNTGVTAANLSISSAGAVTQSQALAVTNLALSGAGGTYNLTNGGNAVGTLAGNTGSVILSNGNNGLTVGTANGINGLTTTGNAALNTGTGTITTTQAISVGAHDLNLTADDLVLGANLSGTGTLTLQPGSDSRIVRLNYGAGDFNLSTAELSRLQNGWAGIVIGRTSGADIYSGTTTFQDNVTLRAAGEWANYGQLNATDGANLSFVSSSNGASLLGNVVTDGGSVDLSSTRFAGGNVTTNGGNYNTNNLISFGGDNFAAVTSGGNIVVNSIIQFGGSGNTITLNAGTGNVNLFAANGPVDLGVNSNFITLSGNLGNSTALGNVVLTSASALTLPSINASTILARSTSSASDLTLGTGKTLTASGTGNALVLAAGRNFVNDAGSGALALTGGGRWLVYSASPGANTLGGLAGGFNRYSCAYAAGGSCASGSITIPGTGNGLIYSSTPTITATPGAQSVTYGGAVSLSGYGYTLSGYNSGDAGMDSLTGSLNGTSAYSPGSDVGTYGIAYSSGSLASALGYAVSYANNASAITVGQRTLTAALTGLVSKTYDGTTAATLSGANYALSNFYGSDGATVTLNNTASGTYDTKDHGTGKTVSVNGLAISGAKSGNYTLASTSISGAIGTVLTKILTPALTGIVSKTYDTGSTASLAASNYSLPGVIGSEAVSLNNPSNGTYDTIHAGTGKNVSVGGLSLSGADAGNYTLASTSINGAVGTILAKVLNAGLTGTISKTYDTNNVANLTAANYTLSSALGSDAVTLNPIAGTFDTIHAGSAKTVSVNGLTLGGSNASDYQLASTSLSAAMGTITPYTLTAGLTGIVGKTYDGNLQAALSAANYTLSNALGSDVVTLNNPASGTYASKNAGTGQAVSVSGLAIGGADAGDYHLASTSISGNVGTILAKALSILGVSVNDKVYDGTDSATINAASASFTGRVGSDAVTLNQGTLSARFVDPHAGVGKAVIISGFSLSGADSGNYMLDTSSFTAADATIAPKALDVSVNANQAKTYGDADSALRFGYSGLVTGDSMANFTGALSRASGEHVGIYAIGQGTLAATDDYTIGRVIGSDYTINPAALLATAQNKMRFSGEANPAFTISLSGLKNGDADGVFTGYNLSSDANATSGAGMYQIQLAGGSASDYTITRQNGVLTVNAAPQVPVTPAPPISNPPVPAPQLLPNTVDQGRLLKIIPAETVPIITGNGFASLVPASNLILSMASTEQNRIATPVMEGIYQTQTAQENSLLNPSMGGTAEQQKNPVYRYRLVFYNPALQQQWGMATTGF